ncbi:hypothetical protein BQ8482_330098 [Mesorhizobium delmotii]|uniref:Uncharacterized protein n=1 Tax=Mesorhizobium delmotii TaxID=1631247 RepID=A0A2P9AP76_9HYPH|nr:hypothetical protein BQ8482_330098 [Mesorhizobium delmotii]
MLPSSRNFRQKSRWITGNDAVKHFIKHLGTVMKHSPARSPDVTIWSDSTSKRGHEDVTREEKNAPNQAGLQQRQATGARQPIPGDRPGRDRRRPSSHSEEEEAGAEDHIAARCLM